MSQSDVLRHKGAKGDTMLACLQGDVLGHGGAEDKGDAEDTRVLKGKMQECIFLMISLGKNNNYNSFPFLF